VAAEAGPRIEGHEAEGLGGGRLDHFPDVGTPIQPCEAARNRDSGCASACSASACSAPAGGEAGVRCDGVPGAILDVDEQAAVTRMRQASTTGVLKRMGTVCLWGDSSK
jgi:hypothetical protein